MKVGEHRYVFVNGIQLHYVQQGSGPLVILLHGFPEFWYSWRKQIPALAAHYTVVAVDMRGYNESDKPTQVSLYRIEILATDIRKLIETIGYKKAIIIGHDWGGAVAWQLAQQSPDWVEKLIILNCPPGPVLMKHVFTNFKQLRRSWYMFAFQIPGLPERNMQSQLKLTLTKAFKGWSRNKEAFREEDIDKYVKVFAPKGALTGPINYYRAAFRYAFSSKKFRPIPTDTLVIWGEDDRALGKELTYDIPKYVKGKYEIKYIPNCSHWVQNDAPDLVNQYILEYLNPTHG
ncbi:MAG: alpha/beta hydrolase [Chitinophagales bacterium]|nr:alpha/beta hydrolase [Chitinophagales bacterium]